VYHGMLRARAVAVLLNQASNLRFRLDLLTRISDGALSPASLEVEAAVERYRRGPNPGFIRVLELRTPLLDLDLIRFLEALEAALERAQRGEAAEGAALEASQQPILAVRLEGGPDAFQVEVGIDLSRVLEQVAGTGSESGADLALFRFLSNGRAVLAFCNALLAEFARFPTDPSRVAKGSPE
jgi:hypothetical protein